MDSDDWIERDMYQILYEYTNQEEYVVVRGKFVYGHEASDEKNSDIINTDAINSITYEFEKHGDYYYETIDNTGSIGEWGSICSGIYDREMIIKNQLWFPEKIAYEDNY